MHHGDGAFDDAFAGGDDSGSLLALQHGLGNFGSVGEGANAGFDDGEAGGGDACSDFVGEFLADVIGGAAQADDVGAVAFVVGVGGDDVLLRPGFR